MSQCIVNLAKTVKVGSGDDVGPGSFEHEFLLDADAVAIFLCVDAIDPATTLDLTIKYALDDVCPETTIVEFPQVASVPTEIIVRKTALSSSKIKACVDVTGGAATYTVHARGAASGEASVRISGANSFTTSKTTVTTTAGLLIPAALADRSGILIENANDLASATDVLYIAESLAKATTDAKPVRAGGNITIDIAAGQAIYAVAGTGTVDCRVVEVGG